MDRREACVVMKRQHREFLCDAAVCVWWCSCVYFDCVVDTQNYIDVSLNTHTHTCWSPGRTGLYQYQYPGCCIIVLEHVTIGGNWAKCTQDLTVLFLTISYGPTITSIKISINNNNTYCHWCWDHLLWCPYINCKMRTISPGGIFMLYSTF